MIIQKAMLILFSVTSPLPTLELFLTPKNVSCATHFSHLRVVHTEKKHALATSSIQSAKRLRIKEVIDREHKKGDREIKSLEEVKVDASIEMLPDRGAQIECDATLYRFPIRESLLGFVEDHLASWNGFISSDLVLKVNNKRVGKTTLGVVAALKTDVHGKEVLIASVKPPFSIKRGTDQALYGQCFIEVWLEDEIISAVSVEALPPQKVLLPSSGLTFIKATSGERMQVRTCETRIDELGWLIWGCF